MSDEHVAEGHPKEVVTESILDFSELEQAIQSFTRRFDQYVQTTVASCEQARIESEAQRTQDQEKVRSLEREREDAKHAQKNLWENVASEREADAKLRSSVQSLHAQRETLTQRIGNLKAEVEEMRMQMETRKHHKQEQIQRLREQVRRNAPELAQLEMLTGCTISPSVQAGTIDLGFSLLHAEDPTRTYTFTLDVSQPTYLVPKHDTALPSSTVKLLVNQLNQTGEVHEFIKKLRQALLQRTTPAN